MSISDWDVEIGCLWIVVVTAILSIPAWFTHLIYCFKNEQWGFLIAGAIAPPIGVIHGWWIWISALFGM